MQFIRKQWFLIVLLLALAIGFGFAAPLKMLTELSLLKWIIVSLTMMFMTWPIELRTLLSAGCQPIAPLIATIVNLLLAPVLAWPFASLLGDELGAGLILAASVPSTLASAAVWTRRAGGNDSISIVVTIVTNLLCFVATPIWVFLLIGVSVPRSVLTGTISNLFLFVVIPMVAGQLLRILPGLGPWATNRKSSLAIWAQFGVLFITMLGAINMRHRIEDSGESVALNLVLATVVLVSVLHLVLFVAGTKLGVLAGQSVENQIAIGFSGSQKTLMVGLSTALSMGLNIIPIVAYHALQLVIDTLIADRYRAHFQNADSRNQNETSDQ